jgi:hypothetical protein
MKNTLTLTIGVLVSASVSIGGCAFVAPTVLPEKVAVPVATGGPLQPISLTLYACTVIIPEIHFSRGEASERGLLGPLGAKNSGGWTPEPGVPLRLTLNFIRIPSHGKPSEPGVLWRTIDRTTRIVEAWSGDDIARMFGSVTLPAGSYRVEATLVKGAPELSELHSNLLLWSTFKLTPTVEDCVAPGIASVK